jgi:hypothetical protein
MYHIGVGAYRPSIGTRKRTRAEAGLYGNLEQLQDPKFKGKRRHFNEGEVPEIIAFLEAMHAAKHPEKPKREKKRWTPKFVVQHSLEMKAFVVWLRYGTLRCEEIKRRED